MLDLEDWLYRYRMFIKGHLESSDDYGTYLFVIDLFGEYWSVSSNHFERIQRVANTKLMRALLC